jgi:hypothetical protein
MGVTVGMGIAVGFADAVGVMAAVDVGVVICAAVQPEDARQKEIKTMKTRSYPIPIITPEDNLINTPLLSTWPPNETVEKPYFGFSTRACST